MTNINGINIQIVKQTKTTYLGFSIGAKGLHFYEYGDIMTYPTGALYNATFYGTLVECEAKFMNNYPIESGPKGITPKLLAEKQISDIRALLNQIEEKMNSKNNYGKYIKIQRKSGANKIK